MATNPKSTVKAVLQAYDKKEEWDFEASEPAPAPAKSPLIVSYNVEMPVLREVERACDPSVVATGVLIAVARNKDGSPKMDREQVCLDLKRDICPDGRYVSHLLCNQYGKDDIVFRQLFPNKEHQDALALGYPQGAGNLVSLLGLTFIGKMPNVFNGIAKLTAGSVFARDDHTLNLTTVASGLTIPVMNSGGDIKEHTIPGEIFVTAKTRGVFGGGLEILSVRTSNELLAKLLKHMPGNPSLNVYGYELIDDSGNLIPEQLALAIERAKDEERAARANLEGAIAQFKAYQAKQQDKGVQARLKDIEDKIVRHTRKRGHDYKNGRLVNGDYVVTLDTAMAIAVYRDLPAVLSGEKKIEECPLLLHTIVWCGDTELSTAITDALLENKSSEFHGYLYLKRLSNLLKEYAKGDDKADVAQQRQERVLAPKSDFIQDKPGEAVIVEKRSPQMEEIEKIKAALNSPARKEYKALCSKKETLIAELNKQEKQKKNVRMGLGTGTPIAGMLGLTVLTVLTGGLALVPILVVVGVTAVLGAIGFGINEGVARVRQNRLEKELGEVKVSIQEILEKNSQDFDTNKYMRYSTESLEQKLRACYREERFVQRIAAQDISDDDFDPNLDIKGNPHHNERDRLLSKRKKVWTGSTPFFSYHTDDPATKIKSSERLGLDRESMNTMKIEGH